MVEGENGTRGNEETGGMSMYMAGRQDSSMMLIIGHAPA